MCSHEIRDNDDNMPEAETDAVSASSLFEFSVSEDLDGHRLDYAVSRELGLSRNYSQHLIKQARVTLKNAQRVKPSLKLRLGDSITVNVPPPEKLDLEPEDIDFGVVYSDDDIIIVDKPAGLVVHPAPGHWRGTLVHGLLFRFPELGSMNGVERPGIVHRLDATTSGLMVVARNGLAQERLWADFKERRVSKTYLALAHGTPKKRTFRVDLPIARDPVVGTRMTVAEWGRPSVTDFETLWSRCGASLMMCRLHTGRTHQIRVHLKAIGHPLVGDALYAPKRYSPFDPPRVFLHSWKLGIKHPRSGEEMTFCSHLPRELIDAINAITSKRQ